VPYCCIGNVFGESSVQNTYLRILLHQSNNINKWFLTLHKSPFCMKEVSAPPRPRGMHQGRLSSSGSVPFEDLPNVESLTFDSDQQDAIVAVVTNGKEQQTNFPKSRVGFSLDSLLFTKIRNGTLYLKSSQTFNLSCETMYAKYCGKFYEGFVVVYTRSKCVLQSDAQCIVHSENSRATHGAVDHSWHSEKPGMPTPILTAKLTHETEGVVVIFVMYVVWSFQT